MPADRGISRNLGLHEFLEGLDTVERVGSGLAHRPVRLRGWETRHKSVVHPLTGHCFAW